MSNTRLDRAGVKAKFDVYPEQIVDYLALVGDSSDNIPGVTGVGPKTAAKWLNQYQTLDALIAHAAEITGKVGENLRNELPALELSRKLATIDTAARARRDPGRARPRRTGRPCAAARAVRASGVAGAAEVAGAVRAAFCAGSRLDCARGRSGRCRRRGAPAAPRRARRPSTSRSRATIKRSFHNEVFDSWLARLAAAPLVSFDTETDGVDYMRATLVGLSFAISPGEAAYVPLGHDYAGAPEQLDRDTRACRAQAAARGRSHCPSSGITSSSIRTFLRTTASRCAGSATIRCSSRTCSTASPRATTWIRPPRNIWDHRPFTSRTLPARARSRSPSTKSTWIARRNMRPRMRTSRCGCIGPFGRRSRRCRA